MSTLEQSGDGDNTSTDDASAEAGAETSAAEGTGEVTGVADDPPTDAAPDDENDADEGIVVEIEGEAAEPDPVAELEAKVKENYERLVRTTADFDNFRKRSRREIADARVDEQSRVLREMLPVIDNLERAIDAATGEGPEVVSIRKGLELVLRQFSQALERFQVARIEAKGQAFDPNLHEAVSQFETDEVPPGTVVEVLQPGYTIGNRLLRAALSVVAKAPTAPEPEPEPAAEAASEEPAASESEASEE